jgi:hypothetical protein
MGVWVRVLLDIRILGRGGGRESEGRRSYVTTGEETREEVGRSQKRVDRPERTCNESLAPAFVGVLGLAGLESRSESSSPYASLNGNRPD